MRERDMTMTHEEDVLRRTINIHSGDDTPRLKYADWLDEHGQSERAEFVRVQCELAGVPDCLTPSIGTSSMEFPGGLPCRQSRPRGGPDRLPWCEPCARLVDLRRRERELVGPMRAVGPGDAGADWFPGLDGFLVATEPIPRMPADEWVAVVRRGFVDEVRLPLAAFVGGPCGRCRVPYLGESSGLVVNETWTATVPCPACLGERRVEGLARRLFDSHPVTRVVPTDREPLANDVRFNWWKGMPWHTEDEPHLIPGDVWDRIDGHIVYGGTPTVLKWFPSREAALAALSAACVAYGRSLVDWVTEHDHPEKNNDGAIPSRADVASLPVAGGERPEGESRPA